MSLPCGRPECDGFSGPQRREAVRRRSGKQRAGFGGDISVLTGFDATRDALVGIGITTMKETPGIGTQVTNASFTDQFRGAALPVGLSSDGGGIDAISGATISSSGVVGAVAKASQDYAQLKDQILAFWQ